MQLNWSIGNVFMFKGVGSILNKNRHPRPNMSVLAATVGSRYEAEIQELWKISKTFRVEETCCSGRIVLFIAKLKNDQQLLTVK